jgi:hypothetical protein
MVTDASSPVKKSVAYERCEWGSTSDCVILIKCDLVAWLDTARLFFTISTINWVNKTICDSVNHTRFPKEKHLPYWARRGNKDKKGDRVEYVSHRANAYENHSLINVCGRIQIRWRMQKIRAKFHVYPQGRYTVHLHWQLLNGTACRPSVSNRKGVVPKMLHLRPSEKHECRSTDFDVTHAEPIRCISSASHSTEICQEACRLRGKNSFKPFSKVWLSRRRLSRNSRFLNNF